MIYKRCIEIIELLSENEKALTISFLSQKLCVSPRSIRNDLDVIDEWLIEKGQTPTRRIPGLGVFLDNAAEVKLIFKSNTGKNYIKSSRERVLTIAGMILSGEKLSYQLFMKKLDVSNSTIYTDMIKVEKWFKEANIRLETSPQHGIYCYGSEKDIRSAYYYLIYEIMNLGQKKHELILTGFEGVSEILCNFGMCSLSQLVKEKLSFFMKWIKNNEWQNDILTDDAFCELFFRLVISLDRILKGNKIEFSEKEISFFNDQDGNIFFEKMITEIESEFNITFNCEERLYFSIVWSSLSKFFFKTDYSLSTIMLAELIIDQIEIELGFEIKVREELVIRMAHHLNAFLSRILLRQFSPPNNLAYELKKTHPRIFTVIRKVIVSYFKKQGIFLEEISDVEISYISMYIIAELHALSEKKQEKVRVLVVCGSSIGTSKILENRLKAEFLDIEVVDSVPYNQYIKMRNFSDINLIISTVPLRQEKCPVIVVDPLLSNKDINVFLNKFKLRQKKIELDKYLDETVEIATKVLNLTSEEELQFSIALIDQIATGEDINKVDSGENLLKATNLNLIELNVTVANSEEAIRRAGNLLMNEGIILSEHIDEMINLKRKFGGYMVLDEGIAMPHLFSCSIKEPKVSILTLDKPVDFGNKKFNAINIVFMLVTNDRKKHIKIIEDLIELIDNKKKITQIGKAKTPEEVISLIAQNLD